MRPTKVLMEFLSCYRVDNITSDITDIILKQKHNTVIGQLKS